METKTQQQSVCFAYFGDGKFLGWYADTSGSLRPHSPKVYSSLENMLPVITKNFRNKLNGTRSKALQFEHEPTDNAVNFVLGVIEQGNKNDLEVLNNYEVVELRAVACPEYDGPNPDFDDEAYLKLVDEHKELFNQSGLNDLPVGLERFNAVQEFNKKHPHPKSNNWVYADYSKVQKWAKNEPTEFLEVITTN